MLFSDDHSRVVLTQLDGNSCSDYINASYIDVSSDVVSPFTKTNLICGSKFNISDHRVWRARLQLSKKRWCLLSKNV